MLKKINAKVQSVWTTSKKIVAAMSVWGLIFSLVTIGRLGVAFDYDETLVSSGPAFAKAAAAVQQPFTPQFWSIVNQSYDLEQPKLVGCSLAWLFRVFGFKVTVVSSRPAVDGEALRKEWRRLVSRGNFIFAGDNARKHEYLQNGNYVLFFGASDSGIAEARKARVFPIRIRIRRGLRSLLQEDYHPGSLGEFVLPFSEY